MWALMPMFLILAISVFMAFLDLSGLAPAPGTEGREGHKLSTGQEKVKYRSGPAKEKYIRLGILSISENLTAAGLWSLMVKSHFSRRKE